MDFEYPATCPSFELSLSFFAAVMCYMATFTQSVSDENQRELETREHNKLQDYYTIEWVFVL